MTHRFRIPVICLHRRLIVSIEIPARGKVSLMSQPQLSSEEIESTLHLVFDQQIINYGAYNLVFATGSAIYRNPDVAALQQREQAHFLIGYRDQPQEVVVAPLSLPAVETAGSPTSIDNTNSLRAYALNNSTFGLESTNGTSFVLRFAQQMEVESTSGYGVLDQSRDVADFQQFLINSWLEPLSEEE